MKTFREQLNFIQENDCHISDICIAGAADACFDFNYTAEEFEVLCAAMQHAWLASGEISEDDIAYAINDYIRCGGTVDEICEMSKWDLLNAAVNGWPEEVVGDGPWCEDWQSPENCQECEMIDCNCNPKHEN